MALVVVTTPGDPSANSFADSAALMAYATTRVPAVTWITSATADQIAASLIMSCRVLSNCFEWTGQAATDTQALVWPRLGMLTRAGFPIDPATNPSDLITAQCELALQMGAGDLLSDSDAAKNNVASVKAGSVAVQFQPVVTSTRESVDILIRRMDSQLLYVSNMIPTAVRMLLVESWYKHNTITRPIIFKGLGL